MRDMFIDGGFVYLRAPDENDLQGNWYRWLNDPEVTKYQDKGIYPNTYKKQQDYFNRMVESDRDIIFAIVDKETDLHIGSVGLHNISYIHRNADIGILIGEKEFWGKGYGKIAWNMATWYGLYVLNLHRINAAVLKDNEASLKSAKASGFSIEGIRKDLFFKNGLYHDTCILGVLKDQFIKLFPKNE